MLEFPTIRFEFSLENGIGDAREKELAMGGITRFGDQAVPFTISASYIMAYRLQTIPVRACYQKEVINFIKINRDF